MTRLPCLALAACLPTLAALGQMAEQPGVDLQAGLILHPTAKVDLASNDDGGFALPDSVERKVGDFTFACSLRLDHEPGDIGDHALEFALVSSDKGFNVILALTPGGGIMVRGSTIPEKGFVIGQPQPPLANRTISVAVVIKRDAKQALSGLWLDGIEVESFNIPIGAVTLDKEAIAIGGTLHSGIVSNLRLYNRSLTRPEIIALAQQDAPKPTQDIIALLGGSEAVALAESGWLEALLSLQRAGTATQAQPRVRDLAWEGDTVFEQKRPLNFGALNQQLERVQARQVMIMFGRQECLEHGAEGVPAFRDALTKLVRQCPPGAVLIGPVPFEKKDAPLPDLSAKNAVLDLYTQAMSAVATEHGGRCVFTSEDWPKSTAPRTRDGLTLNDHGTRTLADIIAAHVGDEVRSPGIVVKADRDSSRRPLQLEQLRTLAQAKEKLWHQYWRPSNWAFLYGDRTAQPSSRDHLNPSVRWFPQELEQYRTLISQKENELWKLSQELGRKLP